MKRLSIAFFYDDEGIVDDYMYYLLTEMAKSTTRNVFVSNGPIPDAAYDRIQALGYEIVIRANVGFDVWAYKAGIEHVGYENLAAFDEIILFNHTFFGPIFPFEEMFGEMDGRACDFWGITAHKEMVPNPFTQSGILPWHLNSHFIAVRNTIAASSAFHDYWRDMPDIVSYIDSVLMHESRFSQHFKDLGYSCSVYDDDTLYSSHYPCFINVDEAIDNRCPILKRRLFFHDPVFIETNGVDLPLALRKIRDFSGYDVSMIWTNIVRTAKLRTLNTNAALTSILPDKRLSTMPRTRPFNLAVCAHIYYTDMMPEMMGLTRSIPEPFDFIATTDTAEKAREIRRLAKGYPNVRKIQVIVMETNRGRDMASLFITCRDLFLDGRYDLVCRIHSKKSPQVEAARSNLFKRHMFENLLNSPGYVENVLDLFHDKPWVGLAVPPVVHISYPTLGNGWFENKPRAREVAAMLGLHVALDDTTPVGAYGTMFWFRPVALRKLFAREWHYEDFNAEPNHVDGGLAHVLERLIAYTAQDAGYTTEQIITSDQAAWNYAMLEFKYSKLAEHIPQPFIHQVHQLKQWADAGHPIPVKNPIRDGYGFKAAFYEDKSIELPRTKDHSDAVMAVYHDQLREWRKVASAGLRTAEQFSKSVDLALDRETVLEFLTLAGEHSWVAANQFTIEDRVTEYLVFGWAAGPELCAMFDSNYYLNQYPDIAIAAINPLVHFIRHGWREGRQPHPLFDPHYYKAQAGLDDSDTLNPLLHFLQTDLDALVSPCPLFDCTSYYNWYPEVRAAGVNALVHYIQHGAPERRTAHVLFDLSYYEAGIGCVLPPDINPLTHYMMVGSKLNIDPHPLFDILFYKAGQPDFADEPLSHFLTTTQRPLHNPHPLFDAADYWALNPQVSEQRVNPLVHYLLSGNEAGLRPSPYFDGPGYLEKHPEIAELGLNPLVHYVKYGATERRAVPAFDPQAYVSGLRTVPALQFIPFVHYLKHSLLERVAEAVPTLEHV